MNKKNNRIYVREKISFLSNTLNKNKILLTVSVILIVTVFIVLSGKSYAYFEERVDGSCVSLEVGKLIHSLNSNVILDAGEEVELNLFVKSNDNIISKYQVYYTSESDLSNVVVGYTATSVNLPYGDIETKGSKNITLTIENKSSSKVAVEVGVRSGLGNNAVEDIILEDGEYRVNELIENVLYVDSSGANIPELTSGMIPVIYNEKDNTWEKADTSEAWYDYDNQIWANAVTVTKKTRSYYMDSDAGEPISMDDINTMWVWIPRYEYQYTDLGTSYAGGTQTQPGEIKINFISSDTTTPSDSTKYQIPAGFKFGEENIPGFWMGKFETSTLESCTVANGSINTACDLTTLTPQIKPNAISWRGTRISTFFETTRLMQSSDKSLNYNAYTYGFDIEGTTTMDTHMIKNTEWGIVAYLSQSKYGKYGNLNYSGINKEVTVNNCSSYITGIGADKVSDLESSTTCTTNTYETNKGQSASTTGTIYGVYDMSGGAYEYVMGNYNNISGYSASYNSGFCGTNGPTDGTCRVWPNSKYFDLYTSDTASSAYKFGDGTYEVSGWYSDTIKFVSSSNPWFIRGDYYNHGSSAGIFYFNGNNDKSSTSDTSRVVIKP